MGPRRESLKKFTILRKLSFTKFLTHLLVLTLALFTARLTVASASAHPDHIPNELNGSNFTYPFPVHLYKFTSQFQHLEMAYMDVHPVTPNGHTIILLHGKNFCGPTWNETIRVISAAGYRVIIPDHIGFCKSTKPKFYQFSLQQMAKNANGLLQKLGIQELTVMGHSLGGMLATRFALMYPSNTTRLVLVDPLGLEDWKAKGVPYQAIEVTYGQEHASNYSSIRKYEQTTYYVGNWSTAYDVWVDMLVNIYKGPEGSAYAWDQAHVTDMIYTQPVVYEFKLLAMPTFLIVGQNDTTAIGSAWSPPAVQKRLGHYAVLGKEVVKMIPQGTLVEFPNLGHAPFLEDPSLFHATLMQWLGQ